MKVYLKFDSVTALIIVGVIMCYFENGFILDIVIALAVLALYILIMSVPIDYIGLLHIITAAVALILASIVNIIMVIYYISHSDRLSGPIAAMYFAVITNLAREIAAWRFMLSCYKLNRKVQ